MDGALAWPPEDVGGTWGHADFVEAIQNEDHERHDEMLEWVEGIAGGGPAFSDSDISHLTPIVYSELHEDFHANPTLVVVGDGWVYCTAEFQRCWKRRSSGHSFVPPVVKARLARQRWC